MLCVGCFVSGVFALRHLSEDDCYDSHASQDCRRDPIRHDLSWMRIGDPVLLHVVLHVTALRGGAAVFTAAVLDVGAALLVGGLSLRAGIELGIITVFVYVGMRVAPYAAKLLVPS